MIKKRVKRWVFTYIIVGIALVGFTACEEDREIFDNVEIKQETDNESSKGSKPSGS